MAWRLTNPFQRKGYKRELIRLDDALSRQDVQGLSSPLIRMRGALGVGALAGAGMLAVALVLSFIAPKPDGKIAEIMTTRSGGMFVWFNGRLHPVTNLASARLIVGKAAPATVVSDAALRALPTGPLMGIPNAPNVLDPRRDDTAVWTICDARDTSVQLSLVRGGGITTAVIAGQDVLAGGEDLGEARAVLVSPVGKPDELWLLYRDTRAQIGRGDFAAQSALGLTPAAIAAAVPVSPSLLAAIEPSPALTAPMLTDRGQPSPAVAGSNIGDILTVGTAAGNRAFYLAGRDGVQQVGPVLAQMLINTGSPQTVVDDPARVQKLPQVTLVDTGRFPAQVPTLATDAVLCWSWSKTTGDPAARTRVFTDAQLPVTEAGKAAAVTLLPNTGTEPQATASVMRPGYGWYARVTGAATDSVAAEQLLWIDPTGTRYPIDAVADSAGGAVSYDPTVVALGLNTVEPTPVPWPVAQLYAAGSTLSIRNAQVLQGTLTPLSQMPSPSMTPGAAPPPPPPAASPSPAPPAAPDAATESAPPASAN